MMNDSEFKNKMMNLIKEDARGSYIICGGTLINIDENGYSGYSYMADHAKEANATYESHSKDSFYSKKVASQNADDIWEEKLLEKELQKELRDKKYFQHKRLTEYRNKRQSATASYDVNVITETVAGGDSLRNISGRALARPVQEAVPIKLRMKNHGGKSTTKRWKN